MRRDHRLIYGRGLCGAGGALFGWGALALGAALVVIGLVLIAGTGKG